MRRLGAIVAVGGVALVACVVLYLFDPAVVVFFPPCPFRALTGLQCPGCGTLRAMHALLHGEVGRALALNPLTTLGLPVLGVGAALELRCRLAGGLPAGARLPAWAVGGVAVVLVAFATLRNLVSLL